MHLGQQQQLARHMRSEERGSLERQAELARAAIELEQAYAAPYDVGGARGRDVVMEFA